MEKNKTKFEIDMCNGMLLPKILLFSLPLIASGILQLLFNSADMIVAGRYAGPEALVSIGATSSLINLLINLFLGLSVGANVSIAHFYGAKREKELSDALHTAIFLGIIGGVILLVIGVVLARPLLTLMGTPSDVLDGATAYMRIYFIGIPFSLLYNFSAAILRAVGDTRRPLIFLTISGVINIILNLFFVILFGMGVRGVALATIISQGISAICIIVCMMRSESVIKFEISKLRIDRVQAVRILRVGLPAGLQGSIFAVSNVLIQSSVNSFGSIAVAGNTATANVEGFIYNSMNAFYQTTLSFVSQNVGASKLDRVKKSWLICEACVFVVGAAMGIGCLCFGRDILAIYSSDSAVIEFGMSRMRVIFVSYYLCGMMDVCVGLIRGMGYSVMPMVVSLIGACVFRVIWIFTVFAHFHSLKVLYISYPISWFLTMVAHMICYYVVRRKDTAIRKKDGLTELSAS